MTGQIVIRSSPVALTRRQPLLAGTLTPVSTPTPTRVKSESSSNVREVAGGTAAGCFVVCCCCPCVLVEFLFLALYKVPATLCRRLWLKRRRKIVAKKKGLLHQAAAETTVATAPPPAGVSDSDGSHHQVYHYCDELSDLDMKDFEKVKISIDGSAEDIELDKKMWDQFQNAGFWRSPSQRHT